MFNDSVDQIKYSTTPTHLYHHFQNKRYAIRSWLKWGVVTILKGFLIFWMNWNQFFVMMCYIYMACKFSTHPNWIIVRFIYLYMAVQFLLQFYGCCFLIQLSSAEFFTDLGSLLGIFDCEYSTLCKLRNFPDTLILREINSNWFQTV